MFLKPSVVVEITKKEMYYAIGVVEATFSRHKYMAIITSGQDSHETKPLSLHHHGLALDFRVKHIPIVLRNEIVKKIKSELEPRGFDVVHEAVGTPNEHLHIEFQPKGTESIFVREV